MSHSRTLENSVTRRRALCLLLPFLLPLAAAQAAHLGIAAIVNDDIITTDDVNDRRDFILATSNVPPTPEALETLTPRIVDALINETLELQEAKRLSIEVPQAEIDATEADIEKNRGKAPGSLKEFVAQHHLSQRTMEMQIRAQLAWNKVVQRKLKHNVNIAQDEITRAQLAQAAAPGVSELRIAAISIPIKSDADEKSVTTLAQTTAAQLNAGTDFMTVAQQLADSGKATFNAPVWVPEDSLQPAMQQAIRTLQPGQVTQPLRSQNSYQLISLLDRRTSKPTPDSTEAVVKQISVPLPDKKDTKAMMAVHQLVESIRAHPGSCTDSDLGPNEGKAKVEFIRAKYSQMSHDLRSVVEHLDVTEVSGPLLTDTAVLVVMPCERIEPSNKLPDADNVRRQLYDEKLELEAQKYLRNLHRDAYIDIKGKTDD